MTNNINNHKASNLEKIFSFKNIIMGLVILIIAFFAFSKYSQIKKDKDPVQVSITSSDHTIGNPSAKVSVIEFADLQCPACKAFDPIVSQVIAEYNSKPNSDVKFTYKHFPLISIHQNTMLAAIGSEAAARQGKFWEYKKVMFEKQGEWGSALDAKDKIKSYLPSIGIDVDMWEKNLLDKDLEERVLSNLKEANSIGLSGTPSFIINGIKVEPSEISTVEKMKQRIDTELKK